MKIGVFDSGKGGKYVADRLRDLFPHDEIRYVNDSVHVPYGSRSPAEILSLTDQAIQPLIQAGCAGIVIACNTATMNAIGELRRAYPALFFVGIEPMIKPAAALTKSQVIAVCATPATLASSNYTKLKETYAHHTTVLEPDCSSWATLIEHDEIAKIDVSGAVSSIRRHGGDVIVLGCTHYHYLKTAFETAAPDMMILEPTDAIAERVARELATIRLQQRQTDHHDQHNY